MWQSCGKVVAVEKADFFEFLVRRQPLTSNKSGGSSQETQASNAALAVAGVVVVFWRTRRLAELHYQNLARRIGLQVGARRAWPRG